MGVPVVTLRGRKHGERTTASILTNLGVTQTIADSGSAYVDIAVRLATDATFAAEVRAAIRTGIASSPLTDMRAHTRNLVVLYMSGGNDSLSMLAPYNDPFYRSRRPTLAKTLGYLVFVAGILIGLWFAREPASTAEATP